MYTLWLQQNLGILSSAAAWESWKRLALPPLEEHMPMWCKFYSCKLMRVAETTVHSLCFGIVPHLERQEPMFRWSIDTRGRFEELTFESAVLRHNPLGDPSTRPLWVYLPPGYDADPARRYPTVYQIQGLTGQLDMWRNRPSFRKTFPELADELFATGAAPPCLVVWVDCWTSLGGSQFLDSPATGRYHTYLCDEIVPWVDTHYRTLPQREHRGIAGKSSGGYGALIMPMLRPDLWGGLATHAGDALFEMSYLPAFPRSVRALRDHYAGSFEKF